MGKKWKERQIFFSLLSKSLRMLSAAMSNNQRYGFSNSHVQMWELDHKEDWVPKNWCFQTTVLENTLESPLDSKEIKLVSPKGNQPWMFFGRTDAEAEAPVLWPPDAKSQLTGKDLGAWKDWGHKEKGMTEDEMVGWHHQLSVHEFEQVLGDVEEKGSLACCSPWGCRVGHDWETELSWTDHLLNYYVILFLTKVCIVQTMVFPVVMYRCESWTIKKAEW